MGKLINGRRRKAWTASLVLMSIVLGGLLLRQYFAYRHAALYPYGWSHCCDKGLYLALLNFADSHNDQFPGGEATPEASLSLLYKLGLADANLLRGKSVPETTVQEVLDRGELLGPDTCGWHYVDGLRKSDDSRLAIFWDKAGLDHNGQLLSGGGHIVWLLNSSHPHIKESDWPNFLAEQEQLHKQRKSSAVAPAEE